MADEPELCSCGYEEGTFACKIRHVGVSLPNSEAKQHDKYLAGVKQESIYGV